MKKTLLLTLFSISAVLLHTQNLDSLYNVWQEPSEPDSMRVDAYFYYIWNGFIYSQPDSAFLLAEQLKTFSAEKNYEKGQALSLKIQGSALFLKGDYPEALDYFERALLIEEKLGNQESSASLINNIGIVYSYMGSYPKALEYYSRALRIQEESGNLDGMSNILNNMGIVFFDNKDYPKALEYYLQALETKESLGDQKGVSSTLTNIGGTYFEMNDNTKALAYYSRALEISKKMDDQIGVATALSNAGSVYLRQNLYANSLDHHLRSLEIQEKLGEKLGISLSLYNVGDVYFEQGMYSKALKYCKESLELSRKIGALDMQSNACECLYDTYKAMGDYQKSLAYYEELVSVDDSLYNEENTKKLTQIEMQYKFDKKEAAARIEQEKKDAIAAQELLRQKQVRNGFIGGFIVVGLFAGVFFRQRNKIGKEKKRSEALLLNILPEEVAEELKAKGEAEAMLFDQVTVLFTDFKGFTALTEKVSPKELVNDLHKCFSAFDNICEKYGIEKIKTIGDAYMAAGGLPTPNSTHTKDVIRAAFEIRNFIEKGKADKLANNLPYFEIRIGIHTGPVVAGIVGVKKFQYDIWGDTVNTASRMESAGEAGKVNISQSTYDVIDNDSEFTCESRGKIEVKGKGEMDMYFISKS